LAKIFQAHERVQTAPYVIRPISGANRDGGRGKGTGLHVGVVPLQMLMQPAFREGPTGSLDHGIAEADAPNCPADHRQCRLPDRPST
jgi:hypothetical protein